MTESATFPNVYAVMTFSGENLDPDDISSLVPLKPDHAGRRGDPMAKPRPGRAVPLAKKGVCSFSTRDLASDNINDHVRHLFATIAPATTPLQALVQGQNLKWAITLFVEDEAPADGWSMLDNDVAGQLRQFGIDLDVFDWRTVTFEWENSDRGAT